MVVIHTSYATIKMLGPKGVITINADQRDTLARENAALSQVGSFGAEATQKQSAKMGKTQGGSTPLKTSAPKPLIASTPRPPLAKKGTYVASPSDQHPTDQPVDDQKKGADDKEVPVDTNNQTIHSGSAQTWIPNRNSRSSFFSRTISMSLHAKYHICPGSLGK
jgi:hypothetical protein